MSRVDFALAEANAKTIIQKAESLARVGGYSTIDYPVAIAFLHLLEGGNALRAEEQALVKAAKRALPLLCNHAEFSDNDAELDACEALAAALAASEQKVADHA